MAKAADVANKRSNMGPIMVVVFEQVVFFRSLDLPLIIDALTKKKKDRVNTRSTILEVMYLFDQTPFRKRLFHA
jgi:hypothetical protein